MNTEMMLKEFRYLRKRKIVKVRETETNMFVALHFEDGSFCILRGELCYDFKQLYPAELHELGIITKKEQLKLAKERQDKQEAEGKKMRREQYEHLAKEFGDK